MLFDQLPDEMPKEHWEAAQRYIEQNIKTEIWTTGDISERYGISQPTVSRLVHTNNLFFAVKIGLSLVFLRRWAEPWFDNWQKESQHKKNERQQKRWQKQVQETKSWMLNFIVVTDYPTYTAFGAALDQLHLSILEQGLNGVVPGTEQEKSAINDEVKRLKKAAGYS